MSTETNTIQETNLIGQLTASKIKSGVQPYVPNVTRQSLPVNERIDLHVDEVNEDNYGETIVYRDDSLGQKITIKTLASFFTVKGAESFIEDEKNKCKLLPLSGAKPEQAYDVMAEKGAPVAITIHPVDAYQTAKSTYLENTKVPVETLKKAYAHLQVDHSGDYFPLVVRKRDNKSVEDMENWRKVSVTVVELHY